MIKRNELTKHSLTCFWMMIFLLSYVLLLYLGGQQNLFVRDGDVYFHIATGQWILSHHAVPTSDPFFSETVAGHPWMVYYWLSDVLLALSLKAFGWLGILILPALAVSTSLAILASYLRKRVGFWFTLIAIILSFDILLWRIMPRPHIVELPFAVWIMLPPSMLATVALLHSKKWKYVYADPYAVVFVRKKP